jgi:hypothetical protein
MSPQRKNYLIKRLFEELVLKAGSVDEASVVGNLVFSGWNLKEIEVAMVLLEKYINKYMNKHKKQIEADKTMTSAPLATKKIAASELSAAVKIQI